MMMVIMIRIVMMMMMLPLVMIARITVVTNILQDVMDDDHEQPQ
jgi:hypothetical protein